MARLGDVCVKKVDTIKATYKGNIDYIDISSIDNQRKEITQIQSVAFEDAPSRAKQLVYAGDILVSTVRPNLNAVALIAEDSDNTLVASTGYCVLRCLPNADRKYVFYFCQSNGFIEKLVTQATGASYPAVTSSIVKECSIPLPSLEEQRKIAAVLDKVSGLIAKRCQQLDKLDKLVKSRFIEMFGDPKDNSNGWPVLPLGKLFTVSSSKRIYQSEQTSSGIPFLRISDLVQRMDERTVTAELYISEQHYAALKKEGLVPVAGDILVTSRGTLGRCYEIKEDDRFYFQDGMISWLFDKKPMVTNTYIMQLFQMPGFRKQIDDIPAGSTVNYLSLARLKELRVMCPTIELQEQFIAFVEQVDKSKLAVQQGLQELEILKKSLMQEYFE